jgi:hypothetical protein
VQKLHEAEFVARVRIFEAVCSGEVDPLPANFTDEAWFSFNGHANIQNNRSWLVDNYTLIHPVPLCDTKIGVWCAINATTIIGPNFLSGTFKSESYTTLDKGHPATGRGGPRSSGWVKALDFLDVRHYEGGRSSAIRTGRLYPRRNH